MRSECLIPLLLVAACLLQSCSKEPGNRPFPALHEVPLGFPAVVHPEDNEFTMARWELGKRLFSDPILSIDMTVSCASCHLPELAFTDGRSVSLGVENRPGTRNAPSLSNVAYHPYFTREGGVPTLEMQVLVPIQEHNEFDFNIVLAAERLMEDDDYVSMSFAAYDREPDSFVITRALACFERTLLSGYSSFDQYVYHGDRQALNAKQLRGLDLFFSDRTNCSSCHSGFDFTDYRFANNGLYTDYPDDGRFRLTSDSADLATFKVPSLRNVGITFPYMHDGSISSLEAVIEHYNTGGAAHFNKSELIKPLGLSDREQADLVAFLRSLTDEEFTINPNFN